MPTRRYEQVIRAENAAETRRRILDAVARSLREAPTEQLSVDKVARMARVSRSTVYADFGTRANLFKAFAADLWERTGLPELTEAVSATDALDHLRAGVEAASRMFAQDLDVYRILFAMHRLDPDSVGGAVVVMERVRRHGMEHLARRLDEDGELREDVSVEQATHLLWVTCSFEALDHLMTGRGLDVEEAADLLATTSRRALCRT